MGLMLAGAAVAVLAPGLTEMAMKALAPLGVEFSPDAPNESTNAGWYVLFAFLAVGFVGVFVAPLLFPKARESRESVISNMSGTFPVLQVFLDQDKQVDAGMNELRQLGDEVKRMQGTPMAGLAAVPKPGEDGPIVVDGSGIGASEEPTISRNTPDFGTPAVPSSQPDYRTGKEAAIAAVPSLAPLSAMDVSEEPTMQVSRGDVAKRLESAPVAEAPAGAPVIRKLEGVRAADYKAPEPVVTDQDSTLVRGDVPRPTIPKNDFDELDEPTNLLPSRGELLAGAAQLAGSEDPTHLRKVHDEDLRETVAQPVRDPAGPDATTNVKMPTE